MNISPGARVARHGGINLSCATTDRVSAGRNTEIAWRKKKKKKSKMPIDRRAAIDTCGAGVDL